MKYGWIIGGLLLAGCASSGAKVGAVVATAAPVTIAASTTAVTSAPTVTVASAPLTVAATTTAAVTTAATTTTLPPTTTTTTVAATTTTTTKAPATTQPAPSVGTPFATSEWTVLVRRLIDPQKPANDFGKAKPGNHLVSIELDIMNHGAKPSLFSTLACLKLKDSQNFGYDVALTSGVKPTVEGDVAPGDTSRGFAVFEVPDGSTGYRLVVGCFGQSTVTVPLA